MSEAADVRVAERNVRPSVESDHRSDVLPRQEVPKGHSRWCAAAPRRTIRSMTPQDPPFGPAAPPPARRVTRSTGDGKLGGVAAGLGRHLGIDPTLVRVAFAVLALFGGSGIALYVILWIVLPAEDGASVLGEDTSTARKVALGVLLVAAVVSLPFAGPGFFVLGPAVL